MKLATLTLLACFPMAASAQEFQPGSTAYFVDGNLLYQYCENDKNGAEMYVTGVIDANASRQYATGVGFICIPEGARTTQARGIVCDYLDSAPHVRHGPAMTLSVFALETAWPCPR